MTSQDYFFKFETPRIRKLVFDSDRMPNVLGLFLVAEKMGHILGNYLRWLLYLAQKLNNREGVAHK